MDHRGTPGRGSDDAGPFGHDRLITTQIYLNLSLVEVLREFRERW